MTKDNLSGKGVRVCACSHCGKAGPSVRRKSGKVGITRTSFYRETITCNHCNIEVVARTPGNAVALWNRSYAASKWFAKEIAAQDEVAA